jgi:hypothetical protein
MEGRNHLIICTTIADATLFIIFFDYFNFLAKKLLEDSFEEFQRYKGTLWVLTQL